MRLSLKQLLELTQSSEELKVNQLQVYCPTISNQEKCLLQKCARLRTQHVDIERIMMYGILLGKQYQTNDQVKELKTRFTDANETNQEYLYVLRKCMATVQTQLDAYFAQVQSEILRRRKEKLWESNYCDDSKHNASFISQRLGQFKQMPVNHSVHTSMTAVNGTFLEIPVQGMSCQLPSMS